MTKGNPEGPMNRHKALAMGEKIKTMKKGGACMKGGGSVKKQGHAKKRGK